VVGVLQGNGLVNTIPVTGSRVRLTEEALTTRRPNSRPKVQRYGVVVGRPRNYPSAVKVLWDNFVTPERIHVTFLEHEFDAGLGDHPRHAPTA